MRNSLLWVTATCALMAGCAGGNQTPTSSGIPGPALPGAAAASVNLGSTFVKGDLTQTASAKYSLSLDPGTLSASIQLVQSRNAQKNDDLYDLSVDAFFGPGSIVVDSINGDGTTIDVGLKVTHPFNAPTNLSGPATAGNRADLGVATRLLFLAEAPGGSPTYFAGTDDVVTNTGLLSNADGFLNPGGMIDATGLTANAFPFKSVVDEVADNRIGISNGGSPTGNFSPTDGWTQSSMGTGNNGWTGYGVLHQGQSAIVTASFDVAALNAAGGYQLDVTPIVHYNDPRQGANAATKRANRLPPATPDSTRFGYRMPHGAFDIESVTDLGETGGLVANTITATDVRFHIVDWDARATESAETDLSLDPVMSNVAQGESGIPTVEVDIPGVISSPTALNVSDDDSGVGGDVDQDSGAAGDALYFSGTLTNTGSGQNNNGEVVVGLLKASDVEANASFNDGWRFALNPSLAPLTSGIPEPIVYQAFQVELGPDSDPPTYTSVNVPAVAGNGGTIAIAINGLADNESDPLTVEVDWDNNGTYDSYGPYNSPYANPINLTSPITYTYAGPGVDTRSLPIRFKDAVNTTQVTPTPSFVVDSCPGGVISDTLYLYSPWYFASNISLSVTGYDSGNLASNILFGDMATLRQPISNTNRGIIFQQLKVPPAVSPASEIRRNRLDGTADILMTSFGANLLGRHMHQLEVDSTNRVFFTLKTSDVTQNAAAPSSVYPAATGASANIFYFDYSGAAVPFGSVQTISTSASRPVALALDQSDDLYMIDTDHFLRKYSKTGGYAEVTSGGFPLDLKAAPWNIDPNVVGTANEKIHDFVIDWATQTYYILAQTQESAASPGNGYVYRINCDMSYSATVGGNANPRRMILTDNTVQNVSADILIDQLNPLNSVVPGSRQIVVIGNTASTAVPDVTVLNTNLTILGTNDISGFKAVNGTISIDNRFIYTWPGTGAYIYFQAFGPPDGWQ